jgi:two-component system, OmpR family, sensor kinase
MKTLPLHSRLTLWLAAILVVLAVVLTVLITRIAERYHAEVTQRLNAGIAMYVTDELALVNAAGVNQAALKELAHRAMTVNPSAEVYLLATDGSILATLVRADRMTRNRVDLRPVREFLSKPSRRPLYGDDPTSATRSGVFSVAEVKTNGQLAGYLYVVLASDRFASVAAAVRRNYSLQIALLIAAVILALTLAVGGALFRKLTLPLRRLAVDVQARSRKIGIGEGLDGDRRDEIATLSQQFALYAERIAEQVDEIAARDAQRRELIANVSHDLRTPLASLHGYLETVLLKGDQLSSSSRREYLEIAHRHSQQLERLIASLFELSKLETGVIVPRTESFSIAELLGDVALRFRLRAQQLGIELTNDLDRTQTIVEADIALVERALENLIDNALRHTPSQGRIIFSTRARGSYVQIAVTDTGGGVAPADLPHVFDRLYRGRDSRQKAGAGLGLAIVRRIVELHGQRVAMYSALGGGTRVEFGLPVPAATPLTATVGRGMNAA